MGVGGDAGLAGFPRRRLRASLTSTSEVRKSFHPRTTNISGWSARAVGEGAHGILPVLPAKSADPDRDGGIRRLDDNPASIWAGFDGWTVGLLGRR